ELVAGLLGPDRGETEAGVDYLAGQRLLEFMEVARIADAAPARAAQLLAIIDAALGSRHDLMSEEVRYRALQNLGLLQLNQGQAEEAEQTLAEAAEINARHVDGRRRALDNEVPADPKQREALTILYHQALRDRMLNLQRLSGVQRSRKKEAQARASLEKALEIARFFIETY